MIRQFLIAALVATAVPALAQDTGGFQIDVSPLDVIPSGTPLPVSPVDPLQPIDPAVNGIMPRVPRTPVGQISERTQRDDASLGTGARLRGLDKLAGDTTELVVKVGETVALGWLQITLGECRYPLDNPSGDAFAWLVIRENNNEVPAFEGWMVASSPALSALDNSRYDVWVTRCTTE